MRSALFAIRACIFKSVLGKVDRIRTAQYLVDVVHQFLVAIVNDVMRWHAYRPPSTILISSGVRPYISYIAALS